MILYQRKNNDTAPLSQPDPYMIKDGDRYYMYTTGGWCFSSNQLKTGWEFLGKCLDVSGQKNIWAPAVIKIDGEYFMYYSSIKESENDDHKQTLRVAVSKKAEGSFKEVRKILPPFSIDALVVKNDKGLFIFYSANDYESVRPGTYIACDKMLDPYTVEGNPKAVVVPSIDEEIFMRNRFAPGQDWHTIEGAFYFYHEGIHFLMYSGACYQNPTYFIGYSIAYGEEHTDLRKLEWKKYPSSNEYHPLMKSCDKAEGVGHNSVVFDGGKCYVVYHGRTPGVDNSDGLDHRIARLDEMAINKEHLSVTIT